MIGAEAADRGVGGEARALSLLVDLEPGGLPQQVVGISRGRELNRRRVDVCRAHGLGARGGGGDDSDGAEHGASQRVTRGAVGARRAGWLLAGRA